MVFRQVRQAGMTPYYGAYATATFSPCHRNLLFLNGFLSGIGLANYPRQAMGDLGPEHDTANFWLAIAFYDSKGNHHETRHRHHQAVQA
jgi:hypothetical protein